MSVRFVTRRPLPLRLRFAERVLPHEVPLTVRQHPVVQALALQVTAVREGIAIITGTVPTKPNRSTATLTIRVVGR